MNLTTLVIKNALKTISFVHVEIWSKEVFGQSIYALEKKSLICPSCARHINCMNIKPLKTHKVNYLAISYQPTESFINQTYSFIDKADS